MKMNSYPERARTTRILMRFRFSRLGIKLIGLIYISDLGKARRLLNTIPRLQSSQSRLDITKSSGNGWRPIWRSIWIAERIWLNRWLGSVAATSRTITTIRTDAPKMLCIIWVDSLGLIIC